MRGMPCKQAAVARTDKKNAPASVTQGRLMVSV